ncbi:MAG: glycoside hydrolase family 32 protein [Armatimonadota bacterium]|nr:GH32 C-terminal domain-containing protein [bacterium]
MSIFYTPPNSIAGDVIPYYWKGEYHLFHIQPRPEPGSPWNHMVTRDFVVFQDWGEAVPPGKQDEQDADIWTGSVFEHNSTFHIFYTGHNGSFPAVGKLDQVIMHATSPDLRTWTKDPNFVIPPPEDKGYERSAWRDAFVFRNEEAGEFWMLVTARRASDIPMRRRGCVALLASTDLQSWELRNPLWAPEECDSHECPDLFKMGDWWYLVYSTYIGKWTTHYRMSKSPNGPWIAPPVDTFDGDGFYAAKTAGDDKQRYVIAWVSRRPDDKDENPLAWGGTVIAHEIVQRPDGTLAVKIPEGLAKHFTKKQELTPKQAINQWKVNNSSYTVNSTSRFSLLGFGMMPETCLVEATVTFETGTSSCGLVLRADEEFDSYYQLILEPSRQRFVFLRDGSAPVQRAFEQERPLTIHAGEPVKLRILIDGSVIVIYANDEVALSGRMYDLASGRLGLMVTEGKATFADVSIRTE